MKNRAPLANPFSRRSPQRALRPKRAAGARWAVAAVALVALPCVAGIALQQSGGTLQSSGRTSQGFAALPETANPHPDANRFLEDAMHHQDLMKRMTELNELRQKEMTSDTAKLVALAESLKGEMDKGRNEPGLNEVRKVEEIEKLAHGVQSKMRASIGGN